MFLDDLMKYSGGWQCWDMKQLSLLFLYFFFSFSFFSFEQVSSNYSKSEETSLLEKHSLFLACPYCECVNVWMGDDGWPPSNVGVHR